MKHRRMLTVARTEWIHNLRDPRSLFVIVALPVFLLVIYGYGINYDLRDIPFAAYNLDGTEVARDLIQSLIRSGYFSLTEVITDQRRIPELLARGQVVFVLVLPPDLGRRVGAGETVPVQVVLNGADATRANVALGYIQGALAAYSAKLQAKYARRQGLSVAPPFTLHPTILYNPGLDSTLFIVPGLIAILITILAGLLTSTCIVREREWGSFESLVTSPAQATEIMMGKMLPYVGIAFVDVVLAVVCGIAIFHVVPRGSVSLLLAVSCLYLLASLAIGIFFSTIAKTQRLAILLATLTTLLPTTLLSGFVFPLRSMPLPLRLLSNLIPATHFLIIIRGVYLKGAGATVLWPRIVMLAAFTVLLVLVATRKFRKTL